MRVQLISENGKYDDIHFTVSPDPVVLGRSLRADVQFVHRLISRLHCEWSLADGEVIVRDMESTNQTIVNGEPIECTAVRPGDRLLLGDEVFLVEFADVPGERQSPSQAGSSTVSHLVLDTEMDSEVPTSQIPLESNSSPASAE